MSHVKMLHKAGLLNHAPSFVADQIQYEVLMGSTAYGVSQDTSDMDVYGFCIPNKNIVFPHLTGEIEGFGQKSPRFNQFQQHHIESNAPKRVYDLNIYGIVRYFQLVMENNPNMLDSLFVPQDCVLYSSKIGQMVRDNRHLFLSKKVWHTFRGYAYKQLHRLNNNTRSKVVNFEREHGIQMEVTLSTISKSDLSNSDNKVYLQLLKNTNDPEKTSKRWELFYKYGYDTKFAYHIVRLMGEVEQLLTTGTMNLRQDKERLKAIRTGVWPIEKFTEFFQKKELYLEEVYQNSNLPNKPPQRSIKILLHQCLEEHFGNLNTIMARPQSNILFELQELLNKYTQ